jgi:hypothetical protein
VCEVGSLLLSPRNPRLFARPLAASAPGWGLTDRQVRQQATRIGLCPSNVAYSGQPYLAFVARRRMPGNQPDQFIIEHAPADSRFLAQAERDQPRCP